MSEHPVAALLTQALAGRFPPADGGWTRVEPWRAGVEAVVAFTGHAYLAVRPDVDLDALVRLGVDGFGGAHHPRVVHSLVGEGGWVDALDAVLVARGGGEVPLPLVERPDLAEHPRATYARRVRDDVTVLGWPDGTPSLVTLGRGIGGLRELGVEVDPRDVGRSADLVRAAVAHADPGETLVAAVAPGNARALRLFLRGGFTPVASVQLFVRDAR